MTTINQAITNSVIHGNVVLADTIVNNNILYKPTIRLLGESCYDLFLRNSTGYFFNEISNADRKMTGCIEISMPLEKTNSISKGRIDISGSLDSVDIIRVNQTGVFLNGKLKYAFESNASIQLNLLNSNPRCLIVEEDMTIEVYSKVITLGGYKSKFYYNK